MDLIFDSEHLYRNYFKMAFPVVIGMAVALIYNLADIFFITQTGDTNLIAGVSLCAPVFTALMAFGNIFGQGGSSLISRLLGNNNSEGTAQVSSFCFYAALATGAAAALFLLLFSTPMLSILGADSNTMPYARSYYSVLAIGAPVVVASFIHQNLVRCEGLSVESMIGTSLGAVINIILDPILISVVGLGATGAAAATVIGYLCSILYFLILLKNKENTGLSTRLADCRISLDWLRQILVIGATAALSNLMQTLTVVMLNHFLFEYGNDKIAAMGVVLKVSMIVQLILVGFSFGGVPMFGYFYGSRQTKELRKLIRFCITFLSGLALFLSVVLCILASPLMSIFMKEPELIDTAVPMLRWQVAASAFAAVALQLTVLFQATNKAIPAFLMSISRQGVVFLAAIVICRKLFAYDGVIMSQAIADGISAFIAIILLFSVKNLMREAAPDEAADALFED